MMIYEKARNLLIDCKTETMIKEWMPKEDVLNSIADYFSTLSDQTRIRIVSALSISSMCVNDLSAVLSLNQTTVSHQLKNLRSVGIVKVKRQGKVAFYALNGTQILDIMLIAVNRMA